MELAASPALTHLAEYNHHIIINKAKSETKKKSRLSLENIVIFPLEFDYWDCKFPLINSIVSSYNAVSVCGNDSTKKTSQGRRKNTREKRIVRFGEKAD